MKSLFVFVFSSLLLAGATFAAPQGLGDKLVGKCYVLNQSDYAWATNNAALDTCDEKVIQSRISQQFGTVTLVSFTSKKSVRVTTIPTVANQSLFSTNTVEYKTKGKLLIVDWQGKGCVQTDDVSIDADNITLKVTNLSDACPSNVKNALLANPKAVTYKLITIDK